MTASRPPCTVACFSGRSPIFSATRREALLSGWMIAISRLAPSTARAKSREAAAASVAYPRPWSAGTTWYPTSSSVTPSTGCGVRPQSPTKLPSEVVSSHRP